MTRDGFGFTRLWLATCVVGLVGGALLVATDHTAEGHFLWGVTTVIGGIPVTIDVIRSLSRREAGVDMIAILAILGCLGLHEYAAGAVIAVMLASGQTLEDYADRRAHRELSDLLARAPRQVHRYEDGELQTREIDEVMLGDRLFVKSGEVVPVDGVLEGDAVLDESALSGESRPVERPRGDLVRSGALNAGQAFDLHATATAADSTYAGIVRLVEAAEAERAPAVRLADRYAFWFIPITLVVAGAAWIASGDPVRALSVLVVATPCPLILAVPIAIVAGHLPRGQARDHRQGGRRARDGRPIDAILLFDKTGTLTSGVPHVADVEAFATASPGRAAPARGIARPGLAARARDGDRARGARARLGAVVPEGGRRAVRGRGRGLVDGHRVVLGQARTWQATPAAARARDVRRRTMLDGSSCVFVGVDGEVAGALVIDDPIRPDTPRVIRSLRRAGIERVVMVTGDHPDVAESVGAALGRRPHPVGARPGREGRVRRGRARRRRRDDGRRRVERRAGPGGGRRRRRDGRPRRDRIVGSRRRRHHRRSARPSGRRDDDREALAHHRDPERVARHGSRVRVDGVRRLRAASRRRSGRSSRRPSTSPRS